MFACHRPVRNVGRGGGTPTTLIQRHRRKSLVRPRSNKTKTRHQLRRLKRIRRKCMASVHIRDVRKSFGGFEVLHGVSIPIEDGALFVLAGPSPSGKSTLLRLLPRTS